MLVIVMCEAHPGVISDTCVHANTNAGNMRHTWPFYTSSTFSQLLQRRCAWDMGVMLLHYLLGFAHAHSA